MTASAVTQRVRALEASLGTPLVLRTRPCRPTVAGQRVLQHLRRVALLQADLQSTLATERESPISVTIALNSDSLGTWFLPALTSVLAGERILFELIVEDQDHVRVARKRDGGRLRDDRAEADARLPRDAARHDALPVARGRRVRGALVSARAEPHERAKAPVVAYSRRDTLQSSFLKEKFGLPEGAYPCHYVPGTHSHFAAVRHEPATRWCRSR